MFPRFLALLLTVYIPIYMQSDWAVSSGDGANPKTNAFDLDDATYWISSTTGISVSTSYIGVELQEEQRISAPLQVWVNQCQPAANSVASVLLEQSPDLVNWTQYGPYSVTTGWNQIDEPFLVGGLSANPIRGLRVKAAANLTGTNRWRVCEVTILIAQPDAYIAPTDTPTMTPTVTLTPTITPTPSNTPTTTPDFLVVVTSTQGSAMAIERKADFGQIMIFGALLALFGLLLIAFGYYFWTNRNNA